MLPSFTAFHGCRRTQARTLLGDTNCFVSGAKTMAPVVFLVNLDGTGLFIELNALVPCLNVENGRSKAFTLEYNLSELVKWLP